jgi:4-aminobutyrate aminotransferase/4-aminobutyrate aminotransferase/(S)-3-amino-2-methylpropionate transaminase
MLTNSDWNSRRADSVARAISYTSTFTAARAEGSEIWDVEGKRYIDFCGGIACQNAGHRHPRVIAAIRDQLDAFTHTCFQISPYEGYIRLAERLNVLAPGDFEKKSLFFSSGGEAIENAIKIARFHTGRPALVVFTNGYHGRSYMGMGLSARMRPFKAGFRPFPTEIYRVPFADAYHRVSLEDTRRGFETLFKSEVLPSDVAAVVFEPMQGEGGYNVAEPGFIALVRELCDDHGIVMIADEIQTGFGRTGKLFAMEHFGVAADLACIGKSMGGGLPMSGIVGRAEIIDSVSPGGLGGTFGGNPLGCAAANAMLDVLQEEGMLEQGLDQGKRLRNRLEAMAANAALACIGDVRGLGAMVAIEIVKDRESREPDGALAVRAMELALKKGLVLVGAGPERNVIRFLAPLNTPPAILDEGMEVLEAALIDAATSVEVAA